MSRHEGRPGIAVASCFMHADPDRAIFRGKTLLYTEQKMARTLWRAGALPVAHLDIPEDPEGSARALLERCDGLLLQGGADCAPESYGETPLRPEWSGAPLRDAYEKRLVDMAVAMKLPVLGICRGAQILNVARGGSLYQDIETQVEGSLLHRDWERYEIIEHEVALESPSWVQRVYGRDRILTNTIHHQGLKDIGPGLRVTGRAPDGIVEAVEDIGDDRWLVGIQWHPEWLDGSEQGGPHRSDGDAIFSAFVEQCAAHRDGRPPRA